MDRYTGPIIDAHHHRWCYDDEIYPWLRGKALARTWTAQDYQQTFTDWNIRGTVWIEALAADPFAELAEAEAVRLATGGQIGAALIAHVPLDAKDVDRRLDRCWAISPAFRGVRDILSPPHARSPDLLDRPEFLRGLRALSERGLVFDLMLRPNQMARAAQVLSQVPDLKVAVEHLGSPHDRSDRGQRVWRDGLSALAALPECVVKVSALHCLEPGWTDRSLGRILQAAVDTFGPDRMCLGTDWPVHDETCPGPEAIAALDRLSKDWSAPERHAMFEATARRFYSI